MSWLCARQRVATLSSSRPTRARSRSTRIFTTIPSPLDCTRKFRNFWDSSFALRRLSDRLYLENGLSIVENSEPRSKAKFRNYGEWVAGRKRPLPYQDRLRASIDTAFVKRPADFPEFLSLMEQAGYEVKQHRGAVSFQAPGQERFTHLRPDTFGDGYGKVNIKAALSGSCQRSGQPRQKVRWLSTFNPCSKGKATAMNGEPRYSISNRWPPPLPICRATA